MEPISGECNIGNISCSSQSAQMGMLGPRQFQWLVSSSQTQRFGVCCKPRWLFHIIWMIMKATAFPFSEASRRPPIVQHPDLNHFESNVDVNYCVVPVFLYVLTWPEYLFDSFWCWFWLRSVSKNNVRFSSTGAVELLLRGEASRHGVDSFTEAEGLEKQDWQ